MTDAELIARLRQHDGWVTLEAHTHLTAAARIEELLAEREKDHANINLKADFIDKTINQLAEADAKLAKAVEGQKVNALEQILEERGAVFDAMVDAAEDAAGKDVSFNVVVGRALRAAIAEIKGE